MFQTSPTITSPQEQVVLDSWSEASLRKMAGNGMSLPCAGFVMLMTIMCIRDI